MLFRSLIVIYLIFSLNSCSKDITYEPSIKKNPFDLYNEALDAFNLNDFFYASEKFNEAELNFDNMELAAKSSIMSSFCLYSINFYDEAE